MTIDQLTAKLLTMIVVYSVISLIIGYFYREKKGEEIQDDDSILDDSNSLN